MSAPEIHPLVVSSPWLPFPAAALDRLHGCIPISLSCNI